MFWVDGTCDATFYLVNRHLLTIWWNNKGLIRYSWMSAGSFLEVFDQVNGFHWVEVQCHRLTRSHTNMTKEPICLVEVRTWAAILTNLSSRWGKDSWTHHFVQFQFKLGHECSFPVPFGLLLYLYCRYICFFNLLVIGHFICGHTSVFYLQVLFF